MARGGTRPSGARRTTPRRGRANRPADNEGIIPVLARTIREVEGRVRKGTVRASDHATFAAVALLAR